MMRRVPRRKEVPRTACARGGIALWQMMQPRRNAYAVSNSTPGNQTLRREAPKYKYTDCFVNSIAHPSAEYKQTFHYFPKIFLQLFPKSGRFFQKIPCHFPETMIEFKSVNMSSALLLRK
ncbi:hypothetical protein OBV_13830 [Oscillibacter valericigenes Sjm18-20]|nr:hypothetical protein OBV_13830 [Oscillibacter valericigenes Sjm18-20]